MLAQRHRRWSNIKTTLGNRLLLTGIGTVRSTSLADNKYTHKSLLSLWENVHGVRVAAVSKFSYQHIEMPKMGTFMQFVMMVTFKSPAKVSTSRSGEKVIYSVMQNQKR